MSEKIKTILITMGVIVTLPFWIIYVIIILFSVKDWEPGEAINE